MARISLIYSLFLVLSLASGAALPNSTTPEEAKPTETFFKSDPAKECVYCYHNGAPTDRTSMIRAVEGFCNKHYGTIMDPYGGGKKRKLFHRDLRGGLCVGPLNEHRCTTDIDMTAIALPGEPGENCKFEIDGPSPNEECGRIFRRAIDECNTDGVIWKQGGVISSKCFEWTIDPNLHT